MNVLLEIIQQQADSYNARFQSNNKEDINHMLEGLENYPIYSLHRQRSQQLNHFGVLYAKALNMLILTREQLKKKKESLMEMHQRMHSLNHQTNQAVFNLNEYSLKKKITCKQLMNKKLN